MSLIESGLFRLIQKPPFEIGCYVQICNSARLPLPCDAGEIVDIQPGDLLGAYVVRFRNGLKFRYHKREIRLLDSADEIDTNPPYTDPALTDPCPITQIEVT